MRREWSSGQTGGRWDFWADVYRIGQDYLLLCAADGEMAKRRGGGRWTKVVLACRVFVSRSECRGTACVRFRGTADADNGRPRGNGKAIDEVQCAQARGRTRLTDLDDWRLSGSEVRGMKSSLLFLGPSS